jgi:hypothetical protein
MAIEKLHVMPSHHKTETGYAYEAKYINKLYQFENKLVYFSDSTFQEFPLELYNSIAKDVKSEIETFENKILEFTNELDSLNVSILNRIEESGSDVDTKLSKAVELLAELKYRVTELEESSKNIITKDNIESMIDKKLESVYNSFEKLSQKFVKDNMENALKDSKREASGKLKIASLAIFKELGYTPEEIRNLAESGLI